MKVKLAKTAGFCMGVRRALDMVLKSANHVEKPLYTFGPLIHNPQVLELLEKRGIQAVDSLEEIQGGTVFIRAHGVPPDLKQAIAERCTRVVDATCPHVVRAQVILKKYAAKGYTGVIVGDPDHAEVMGLLGFTRGKGVVVQTSADLKQLPPEEKVVLVAQTTQHYEAFNEIVREAESYFHEIQVERTICGATHDRQAETFSLASQVDGMVVVGGYNSGNTRRLARISREAGIATYHVETDEELDPEKLKDLNVVGVTAGASTPTWMIKRVIQKLENMPGRKKSSWRGLGFRLLKLLLQSNLYVAIGGALLTYASLTAQGLGEWAGKHSVMLMAFLLLYGVHTLNHFLDREAGQFNDPERIGLYSRYRNAYIIGGVLSQVAVLVLAASLGRRVLGATLFVMVMGLLYSIPLVPRPLTRWIPYRKIKDIPGSKSLSIALGWGVVTTLLPALATGFPHPKALGAALILVLVLVFVRSAVFELLDVQGDLIVGKETLGILLGETRTIRLLNRLLAGLAAVLLLVYLAGWGNVLFLGFEICCAYAAGCLWLYREHKIRPGPVFEFLIESTFVLGGAVAWLYSMSVS